MLTTVIFDFDGLIIDTETAWYHSYKDILWKQYQLDLPLEVFAKCVGSDDAALFRYVETHLSNAPYVDELKKEASNLHQEKMELEQERSGVRSLLEEARAAGMNIALASSSTRPWVSHFLHQLSLLPYFDILVTKEDVKTVKPAPDLFLRVLDNLDVTAAESLVFEDSLNGLEAAKKANLKTVIIPNPVTEHMPFKDYFMKVSSMEHVRLQELITC